MDEEIQKALEEKGKLWVISAMVEGSIGYHSPSHAKRLIEKYLNGAKEDYCERCIAIYDCDLERMILSDIRVFGYEIAERQQQIIEYAKQVMNLKEHVQTSLGLLYPTHI